MGKLEGKIGLVTGGNSGIGLATAKASQTENLKRGSTHEDMSLPEH